MSFDREPRPLLGLSLGMIAVLVITVPLGLETRHLLLATPALLLVLPVLLAAVIGGRAASIVVAVVAAVALSFEFIPPIHSLRINGAEDVGAYAVFVVVAVVVGGLVSDLSHRRRTAQSLATRMQEMHDELKAATAEAQRVALLEQLDQHRAALLRSVSHDLRTPLVTIRGVASDLRSEDPYDDATRRRLLDLVIDEAERLDRIVTNLLNLSRIEAGALDPVMEPLDLSDLVGAAARRLRRVFHATPLEVEVPSGLPAAFGDPTLIDLVLTNLLENAVRHGGRGGTVRVGAQQHEDLLTVTVADEGPGVDPTVRERLFEPWSSGATSGSSGVGLAICRSIVEAHGGTIEVHDDAVGGRFSFTLPVAHDG